MQFLNMQVNPCQKRLCLLYFENRNIYSLDSILKLNVYCHVESFSKQHNIRTEAPKKNKTKISPGFINLIFVKNFVVKDQSSSRDFIRLCSNMFF